MLLRTTPEVCLVVVVFATEAGMDVIGDSVVFTDDYHPIPYIRQAEVGTR